MDNLTHTATGLLLGRAGLNGWTPRATTILVLAANAPDIDVVSLAGGSLNYLHYHRHLTHSLAAMPVLALLVVLLVRVVGRKPVRWAGAFWIALAAVASHLLLDFTNVYGIRLLLPFSDSWQRLDLTPVIDIWIWAAFFVAFAGPLLGRLVVSEITSGKRERGRHGRGFAWAALLFLVAYTGGRAVLHARAVAVLDSHLYDGTAPSRVATVPSENPFTWRGLVETGEFCAVEPVDLTGSFDPDSGTIFYKPLADPALKAARQTAAFQTFLQFSQFPLWRVTAAGNLENSKRVEVFDLRFGTPAEPGFHVSALVNGQEQVTGTEFQFGGARPR
jgi:inner membrane protein